MKTRLSLIIIAILVVIAYPACKLLDVTKDVELELTFAISGNDAAVVETYLLDATDYSSDIEEYQDNIKSIEIKEVKYYLTYFNGPSDQTITNGLLTVADENGGGSQVLASLPVEVLEPLLTTEKSLTLDQAGIDRLEELVKNAPHTCLSTLTGDISSVPVDFIVVFHITATMTANPL
jgi:hypothetical protein